MSGLFHMGRRIEDLSKEELIEALEQMYKELIRDRQHFEKMYELAHLEYIPHTRFGKVLKRLGLL